jgi:hypothetical protein
MAVLFSEVSQNIEVENYGITPFNFPAMIPLWV